MRRPKKETIFTAHRIHVRVAYRGLWASFVLNTHEPTQLGILHAMNLIREDCLRMEVDRPTDEWRRFAGSIPGYLEWLDSNTGRTIE